MKDCAGILVSIVIPCYNAEKFIAEAIQSVLDQSHKNCEIIVVDDGSTDTSLEIIKSFGDRVLSVTGPNRGGCHARNQGVDIATGAYIKFLDADDTLLSTAIERQLVHAESLPESTISYGKVLDYKTKLPIFNETKIQQSFDISKTVDELLNGDVLTSCPLHRSSHLKKGPRFNSMLVRGQEWNFHINLALSGKHFQYFDEPIYCYRQQHSDSQISSKAIGAKKREYELNRLTYTYADIDFHYRGNIPENIRYSMYFKMRNHARMWILLEDPKELRFVLGRAELYNTGPRSLPQFLFVPIRHLFGIYFSTRMLVWFQQKTEALLPSK